MQMNELYNIGQILFSINHNNIDMRNIWKWKLDPYRSSVKERAEIYLYLKKKIEFIKDTMVLERHKGFFADQIFRTVDDKILWQYVRKKNNEIILTYLIDKSWEKIFLLEDNSDTSGHLAFEYFGQIIHYALIAHKILTFHGVLMEHQNQGIIISAPSGTGKTTHARLWRDLKRALIINGDKSTCKKVDGVWTGYGLPWSGTSGEQINRNVPIKALVVLERGEYNEAQRIGGLEAFGAVLPHVQCPTWDKELTDKAMELLDDFLNDIPIIRLRCRPDAESVEVLSKVLEEL